MKVFIIAATSADGFIAKDPLAPSTSWTSGHDKKHFVELTKRAGVVVMGVKTFATIGRALPGRRTIVYSSRPVTTPDVEGTNLPPAELVVKLEKDGVKELAVCGGQTIYTMFIKAGVVDSLYLTIEPVIFGSGMSLFREPINAKLELVSVERKDQTVFLEYKILK